MLEADGIGCWLASRDATARKDKAAANLQAIRDSDLVLLIFSAAANASPTVLRDIERAIAYERPVLSLHFDDATPNASLEYYLNLWQWLDASGGVEDKRDDIVAAVRGQLAGTSDAATWQRLDARDGVDDKQEEIVAAVQAHLAQAAVSAESQETGAAAARRRRPSRRTWALALAAALVALALGLGLGLGLTGTGRQGSWTKLNPAGTLPPPGGDNPMVYDPSSGRLITFRGGDILDPSTWGTWAYAPAANTWTELKPAGTPPPRGAYAMAYEPTSGRLILFGGFDSHGTLDDDGVGWNFDVTADTWTDLKPSGTVPPPRDKVTMIYAPATRRLILFGGYGEQELLNDTWAYDPLANAWTELKPSGILPSGRCDYAMVYDPSTGRMILFGGAIGPGAVVNDTWAYDPAANTWTNLNPSGTLPDKRFGCGMAYDPSSHRVIMFGGAVFDTSKQYNDTWAYDPKANTWSELKPSGVLPGARWLHLLAYAPSAGRVIMFGGGSPRGGLNDTWAFTP